MPSKSVPPESVPEKQTTTVDVPLAEFATKSEPPPVLRNFRVSHPDCTSIVVRAFDRDSAWTAYRKIVGIISTPYVPEIVPTDDPVTPSSAPDLPLHS